MSSEMKMLICSHKSHKLTVKHKSVIYKWDSCCLRSYPQWRNWCNGKFEECTDRQTSYFVNLFWGEVLGTIHGWMIVFWGEKCEGKSFLIPKNWDEKYGGSEWFLIGMEKLITHWVLAGCILTHPVTWIQMCSPPAAVHVLNSATFCCIYCIRVHSVVGIVFEYILSVGIVPWCFECR